MNDLKISILQTNLVWEDADANRSNISESMLRIEKSDIILLPEMFTTGFSMAPERIAEEHHDTDMLTLREMRKWSSMNDAVVTGSVSVKVGQDYFNRLYWVRPDGSYSAYDKRHTFGFAGEDQHYKSGSERIIEHWKGWNICPLICYDLRFPVWSRNGLFNESPLYDVLLYVANWPAARREPWKKLLLARAIENQAYVVACNRVGNDANGNEYAGDSAFINPRGEMILEAKEYKEEIISATLNWKDHKEFREKFPVLKDADSFRLQ